MRNLHPTNRMLDAIKEGRPPVGTFNYIRDPEVIEILGAAGMDFVIIDTEHAVMGRETVEMQVIAAQLNGVTPLVRVGGLDAPAMRSYLEMGVQGILVPHVCSAEDCRKAQDAMRYPPNGHASTCRSNRSTGFSGANWLHYLDWVQNASLIAMIEDPEGLKNLEEILDELVPGRDMIMFGKADYTQALNLFDRSGSVDSPAIEEAGQTMMEACRKRNIAFMVVPAGKTTEELQALASEGGTVFCFGVDQNVLLDAYADKVKKCKDVRL